MKCLTAEIDAMLKMYPQCTANGGTDIYSSWLLKKKKKVFFVYKLSVEFYWLICRSNVASSLFRSQNKKYNSFIMFAILMSSHISEAVAGGAQA